MTRHFFRPIALAVFACALLSGCASDDPNNLLTGIAPKAEDAIIVYGGIGPLHPQAQARLHGYLNGAAPADFDLGPQLYARVRQMRLSTISAHPIAADDEAFVAALAAKRGIAPAAVTGLDLAAEIEGADDIMVLSLIGSLEQQYTVPPLTTAASVADDIALVTVSAVLSRPGTGEILLTNDATQLIQIKKQAGEPLANRLPEAYARAASSALDTLPEAVARYGRGRGAATMVTDVSVPAPALRDLFGMRPVAAPEDPCPNNPLTAESPCRKLLAALGQLTTEAMARENHRMVPPWSWSAWADVSEDQSRGTIGTLRIKTTGGWRRLEDELKLILAQDQVACHATLSFEGYTSGTQPAGRHIQERRFSGEMTLAVKANHGQPRACRGRQETYRAEHEVIEPRTVRAKLPAALERSHALVTSRKALGLGGEG